MELWNWIQVKFHYYKYWIKLKPGTIKTFILWINYICVGEPGGENAMTIKFSETIGLFMSAKHFTSATLNQAVAQGQRNTNCVSTVAASGILYEFNQLQVSFKPKSASLLLTNTWTRLLPKHFWKLHIGLYPHVLCLFKGFFCFFYGTIDIL